MIIFSVCIIFYIASILLIVRRLKDIKKNTDKYEEHDKKEAADKFEREKQPKYRFFKSLGHKYSVIYLLPLWLGLIGFSALVVELLFRRLILLPSGANYLSIGTTPIVYGAVMFIGLILIQIIALHLKSPKMYIASNDAFNTYTRPQAWRRSYLVFLIVFVIAFPFGALGLNNYGYYDEQKIVYNNYFQITEKTIKYEEISEVRRWFWHDNRDNVTSVEYEVFTADGRSINIAQTLNQTVDIHNYILRINPSVLEDNVEINDKEYEYINKQSEKTKQKILLIFGKT